MKRIKLKFATNAIMQVVMMISQYANWNVTDDEVRPIVFGILTAGQGALFLIAQFSNPDGTDVAASYERPKKKQSKLAGLFRSE